jgi:tRNA modification GTPase
VTETLACRLTPPGSAAIATIALRGPLTWPIVRGLYQPRSQGGRPLPDVLEPGQLWLGRFGAELGDEVVLAVREFAPAPHAEIHCHGGREVVELLLEALARRGARICDYPEFFSYLWPRDPLRALAEQRVLQAPTPRTAAILLHQWRAGACSVALETARSSLDTGGATAEVWLRGLAQHAPLGRHLVEPWNVVVAGAPNVGKSSLVNALAGYQRSIVSPTPGTTRDVVTATIALDGWPVELADTAGLRQDASTLEGQGIERARAAASSADLCLWVLDASAEPVWPDVAPERVFLVVNKVDLPPAWELSRAVGAVLVSARTGASIPELCDAIARRLVPNVPGPAEAVPFTRELCDAVEEAYAHLTAGRIDETRRALAALLGSDGGERP